MDDSRIGAVIKLIEARIAVLSKEDPTNNERVIREFENLRQSILLIEKQKQDVDENLRQSILKEEEDVDMDDQDDDDEEDVKEEEDGEDPYLDEAVKKFKKRIFVALILRLLNLESKLTPDMIDMIDNPPDDPMSILSDNDFVLIGNLVEKVSDTTFFLCVTLKRFCDGAKEWVQQHPHDSKRDRFLDIISAWDKKVEESERANRKEEKKKKKKNNKNKKSALYWKRIGKEFSNDQGLSAFRRKTIENVR